MPLGYRNKFSSSNFQAKRIVRYLKDRDELPTRYLHNTVMIVCDQLIQFQRLPEAILRIMPGYQAFKSRGIEFTNIYNNRQDCSPSRASFASSQLNVNISDNIDQSWQYQYNPQLNTAFDTIGKTMSRNGFETVWYGKNHFVSSLAPNVNAVPNFNTNTRGCLREYGYQIFNTFGDTYYYDQEGMFADNTIVELKVNDANVNVDYADATGRYIGAIPYLKARARNDRAFHLELHLENPHDTQHFWQNLAQLPTKPQVQFWAPYLTEQVALLQSMYPDRDIYDPYRFSDAFPDAYIQNPNLVRNYFEDVFMDYVQKVDSLPFKDSFLGDYVLDPASNNSQFAFYIGMMTSLQANTSIPENQQDVMSWKNLVNNYYGLLLEMDNYIFRVFVQLQSTGMLESTSVMIVSDHGDMMSAHGMKQKGYPFENSCNVPCLVYSPHIPMSLRGTRSDVLGSLLDLAPTIEALGNIRGDARSTSFQGTSLLNWVAGYNVLVPRTTDVPVFHVYNAWMSYLTYFSYRSYQDAHAEESTVLPAFDPQSFDKYQAFFTMVVDRSITATTTTTTTGGEEPRRHQYKLARYFNFIGLLLYNWKFDPQLSGLQVTAAMLNDHIDADLRAIQQPFMQSSLSQATGLVDDYFATHATWNFADFNAYVRAQTGPADSLTQTLLLSSLVNLTTETNRSAFLLPGYYNESYAPGTNAFVDYYDDPDHNYYFFLYNVTEDANELVNLLDKGYPERQTPEVLAAASALNDQMNRLIDAYNIVRFDMIVPSFAVTSLGVNLMQFQDSVSAENAAVYETAFGLNKSDGDKRTMPYFRETLSLLQRL